MEQKSDRYIHRVGTITAGASLVIAGILFLLHLIGITMVSYHLIFCLWPLILIGTGIELFLSTMMAEHIIYDKGAVFLMILLMLFAMVMAASDLIFKYASEYIYL